MMPSADCISLESNWFRRLELGCEEVISRKYVNIGPRAGTQVNDILMFISLADD